MTRFKNEFYTDRICVNCGYMGSTGCPRADPKCELYVAPPTNEQKLADKLRPLMPEGWDVFLVKCQDNTNLWIRINKLEGGPQYSVCNVPEGTHVDTMLNHVYAFLNGLRHGRKEGRDSLKKDWYDLMKPEGE